MTAVAPFISPFADFLGWVSLQPHDWLDVREALRTHPHYSPVRELHLFSRDLERAFAMLRLDEPLACEELAAAARPVHEGYIAALAIVPAETGDVRAGVVEFVRRETRRNVEHWLRECYGRGEGLEHDIRFYGIDYPTFDHGSVDVGFGLMIDRADRRWLWSRAQFFHK